MKTDDIIRQFKENNEAHKILMDKLEDFSNKLEIVQISIAKLPDELTQRFDERYASKTFERLMYALIGMVLTGFVVALWEIIKN